MNHILAILTCISSDVESHGRHLAIPAYFRQGIRFFLELDNVVIGDAIDYLLLSIERGTARHARFHMILNIGLRSIKS